MSVYSEFTIILMFFFLQTMQYSVCVCIQIFKNADGMIFCFSYYWVYWRVFTRSSVANQFYGYWNKWKMCNFQTFCQYYSRYINTWQICIWTKNVFIQRKKFRF